MASSNLGQLLPLPLFLTAVVPLVALACSWPPFISEILCYLPTRFQGLLVIAVEECSGLGLLLCL